MNNYDMLYNLNTIQNNSNMIHLSYKHMFNRKMQLNIDVSGFETGENSRPKDPVNGMYLTYNGENRTGFNAERFLLSENGIENYIKINSNSIETFEKDFKQRQWTLKSAFSYQYNNMHNFKTGIEVNYYDLKMFYYNAVSEWNDANYNYRKNPSYLAAFFQDRIVLKNARISAGIRMDCLYPDTKSKSLTYEYTGCAPLGNQPPIISNILVDESDAGFTVNFSPRIRLEYLPDGNNRMFASFGFYRQFAQFEKYYHNNSLGLISGYDLAGDAKLPAETTVLLEAGIKRKLGGRAELGITCFFRKESGLTSMEELQDGQERNYYRYNNNETRNVKGLELSLRRSCGKYFNGQINYSLMKVNGNFSGTGIVPANKTSEESAEIFENDPYWDQRHRLAGWVTYRIPGRSICSNWLISMMYQFNCGTPYDTFSKYYNSIFSVPYYPSWDRWDLRLQKIFYVYKNLNVSFYSDIYNLFDGRDRVRHVNTEEFRNTGDPTAGSRFYEWIWQSPRSMKAGARINF